MTRDEEEALAPFLDALAQLLLAEHDRREAEEQREREVEREDTA